MKKKFSFLFLNDRYDRQIHFAVLFLTLFGLIMITSATMGQDAANYMTLIKTIFKQIVFTVVGYISMIFCARFFSFKLCKQYLGVIIIVTMGLMLAARLFFDDKFGAYAWIGVNVAGIDVSLQPSEFAKIIVMIIIAVYLGDIVRTDISLKDLIKKPLFFVLAFVFITAVLQKDMGTAIVLLGISSICFLILKHPLLSKWQGYLLIAIGVGVLLVVIFLSPIGATIVNMLPIDGYQKGRFLAAANPFADQYGDGYQIIKSMVSFSSGGMFGIGFGASVQKYMNFSAASSDFILAIIVEETGFVGFMSIFVAYGIILKQLFKYAKLVPSEKDKVMLIGTSFYLVIHTFFNVGGVTGLIPLTGVPLLLISAGGSSIMSFMISIGITQSIIHRYKKSIEKEN